MNSFAEWLVTAERILADEQASEEAVDQIVQQGLAHEPASLHTGDQVRLTRVLAVLQARRAAAAVELADLGRRRVELARAKVGTSGYLNAADSVTMH
jgi:hypothetical protein